MNCRFCGHPLSTVFVDLGECPPSNSYLTREQLDAPEPVYPLKVFVCDNCFLVQVDEHKRASEIFDSNYAYFSSYSTTWLEHARAYVEMATNRFGLSVSSQVIEIASNDGYLLQYFVELGVPVLGIEPTAGTAAAARQKSVETLEEFFGTDLAARLASEGKQADLLLGNNVLADVPDINDFVEGLKIALKPGGIITMEFPHLLRLVEETQFDTIYHEHFSYLSLFTIQKIFASQGLDVFDVDQIPTHGGSLRIYAANSDEKRPVTANVRRILDEEISARVDKTDFYLGFQERVDAVRDGLLDFLATAGSDGKTLAAYGAAAKGNTLLNYCGITADFIPFVVDASPHKQGLFLPGSHIPIVDETWIRTSRPQFVIILPWNIREEIASQLSYIREWSGQFVTAIPRLQIW